MGLQKAARYAGGIGAGSATASRAVVDGPPRTTSSSCKARLPTQAPDIDASVYLTECDPSRYRPGDFVEVEIVGARDYDLIARPLAVL